MSVLEPTRTLSSSYGWQISHLRRCHGPGWAVPLPPLTVDCCDDGPPVVDTRTSARASSVGDMRKITSAAERDRHSCCPPDTIGRLSHSLTTSSGGAISSYFVFSSLFRAAFGVLWFLLLFLATRLKWTANWVAQVLPAAATIFLYCFPLSRTSHFRLPVLLEMYRETLNQVVSFVVLGRIWLGRICYIPCPLILCQLCTPVLSCRQLCSSSVLIGGLESMQIIVPLSETSASLHEL